MSLPCGSARHARRRWDGKAAAPTTVSCTRRAALVFTPILNKLGFDQLELVVSGGGTACRRRRWRSGRCTASISSRCTARPKPPAASSPASAALSRGPATSARCRPGWQVQLAEDGEVLVQSPDLFEGYWNNEEATRAVSANRRLAAHRRCRRMARRRATADRPRARLHRHLRRQDALAFVHREPAAREPLRRRGGRVRSRPQVSHRPDRDRLRHRRRLGAQPQTSPIPASPTSRRTPRSNRLIQARSTRRTRSSRASSRSRRSASCRRRSIPEEEGEPVTPTRKVKRNSCTSVSSRWSRTMYDDREERLLAGRCRRAAAARTHYQDEDQECPQREDDRSGTRVAHGTCRIAWRYRQRAGRLRGRHHRRADRPARQHLRAGRSRRCGSISTASTPRAASTASRSSCILRTTRPSRRRRPPTSRDC